MQKTILVVDDESDLLELVTFVLKAEGYNVSTASDGCQAIDVARRLIPDLILLDLLLPELDGLAVLEILKSQQATACIPVLMVTGCCQDVTRSIGYNIGVTEYMTKPFRPSDLLLKVKNLTGAAR